MTRRILSIAAAAVCAILLGLLLGSAAWARDEGPRVIGEVTYVQGQVRASSLYGSRFLLQGDPVYLDELLVTGRRSVLEVYLADGTRYAQGEGSRSRVEAWRYAPSTNSSGFVSLHAEWGVFRMQCGEIASMRPGEAGNEGIRVRTPVSVVDNFGAELFFSAGGDKEIVGVRSLTRRGKVLVGTPRSIEQAKIRDAHRYVEVDANGGVSRPLPVVQNVWNRFWDAAPMSEIAMPEPPKRAFGVSEASGPLDTAGQQRLGGLDREIAAVDARTQEEKERLVALLDPYLPLGEDVPDVEKLLVRMGLYLQARHMLKIRRGRLAMELMRDENQDRENPVSP